MEEQFDRDLVRGSLDLMVLSVLADGAKYGYLIQQRIHEATGRRVRMQAGTLYPLLHRMESDGLIRAKWESSTGRPRKWYEISAAGRRELVRQAHDWRRFVECVGRLLVPVLSPATEPT